MTDHPLTESAAAELWDTSRDPGRLLADRYEEMHHDDRATAVAAIRAAFDAGREHERTNPEDARPWELLNKHDPVHVGDEVRQDHGGITRTAVVGWVDKSGDPWTADDIFIGEINIGSWYVRRAVQELPTKCGTVIVANDGHKFIKAEVDGIAHRAREAVLGANGWWYGAWRKAEGDGLLSAMFPEHISAPTWKVDDQ